MARALKIRLRELQRQARAGTLEMQFQQGLVILADVVLAFAPEGTALLQVLRWAHWSRSSYYRRDQTEAIPPPPVTGTTCFDTPIQCPLRNRFDNIFSSIPPRMYCPNC